MGEKFFPKFVFNADPDGKICYLQTNSIVDSASSGIFESLFFSTLLLIAGNMEKKPLPPKTRDARRSAASF